MADLTPHNVQRTHDYLADLLIDHDPALDAALDAQHAAHLPSIEVSPLTGKLLHLLVQISGARRILEIGTLGAYSTIWMARALPEGGAIVSIEAEPHIAAIARANLSRAGVANRVEVREGRAEHVLQTLAGDAPFDLVFIDADKESNTLYLDAAAQLGRVGSLVVLDNVGRSGDVADEAVTHPQIQGVRAGLQMLHDDPRFEATALQTLDNKGWDGLAIARIVA